jgi:hypothetical protein
VVAIDAPGGGSAELTLAMRTRRALMGSVAGILCVVALGVWWVLSPLGPWVNAWLDVKKLERQAKRNVNPAELEQWATNLLARHWTEHQRWEEYYGSNFYNGTNFPSGLRKIGCFSDGMLILIDTQQRAVTIWGMRVGGPWLTLGAPSSVAATNHAVIEWKPGIYFVKAGVPYY